MVPAGHATLQRAMAYLDTRAGLDTDIEDIAREASVTPRAVQFAFRRHLDLTPTGYMRRLRLQHAHDELRDAARGDGVTVTRVALDWGFNNPSRFAAYYRSAYGMAPGETLRG
jgi:transcriptional regulator GlxA family with amidase domain